MSLISCTVPWFAAQLYASLEWLPQTKEQQLFYPDSPSSRWVLKMLGIVAQSQTDLTLSSMEIHLYLAHLPLLRVLIGLLSRPGEDTAMMLGKGFQGVGPVLGPLHLTACRESHR